MLKLSQSQNYLNDLREYENVLVSLSDEKLKKKLKGMISRLTALVHKIDDEHATYSGSVDPRRAKDTVEELSQLRYEISRFVKSVKVS